MSIPSKEVVSVSVSFSGLLLAQSYDLRCMEPKSILLNTVIPGWLWRGMTADLGKQKIPNCTEHKRKLSVIYPKNTLPSKLLDAAIQ
jgi:hypothetical protein